jgi:hypothetical protein
LIGGDILLRTIDGDGIFGATIAKPAQKARSFKCSTTEVDPMRLSGIPVARLKTGFAFSHLQIATRSARDAYKVEKESAGATFGPWFDEILRVVPVSIVMAGAALEAGANELIQDILAVVSQRCWAKAT